MSDIHKSMRWKKKREQILRRDKYLCQDCKRYGKRVDATEVHHIKHVDEYPELAFQSSNLPQQTTSGERKKEEISPRVGQNFLSVEGTARGHSFQ